MFRENYSPHTLKIAYFAGTMQPDLNGTTRALYSLIKVLNKNMVPNIFFSPDIPIEDKLPAEMIKVPGFSVPLKRGLKLTVPVVKIFIEKLKKFNPDIIHINSPFSLGHAAIKLGKKLGIPLVASYHSHYADLAGNSKLHSFESYRLNYIRHLYNKCMRVYVPSRPVLKELRMNGIKNTVFLPYGVDTEIFNPVFRSIEWRRSFGIENKIIVLYAGKLEWKKNLAELAEAYQIISQSKRQDIVFVIAGKGPAKEELRKLMPKAIFLGYLLGRNLSIAYSSCDIFAFPSASDAFGNSVLEAMSSGIPAVCVNVGGACDIIEDGITGFIANPNDAQDFAKKITLLAENTLFRLDMGHNALRYAREHSWNNTFSSLYESYREVVEEYKSVEHSLS